MIKSRAPLPWTAYWDKLDIYDAVCAMPQLGIPPSSLHAVHELDNDAALHAYFEEAKDDQEQLDARVITAVHLYYLTRYSAEPVQQAGVLPSPANGEPPLWWQRLVRTGSVSYWLDVVGELAGPQFRRSARHTERRLHRDARAGKLTPQGIFMTILDSQPGEALVSVCSVVDAKAIIMTGKVVQGYMDHWPAQMRTTTSAMLHAAVAACSGESDGAADTGAHDIIAATLSRL